MISFFVHYAETNIVCIIIFLVLLFHDLFGVDRQEKQIKYDNVLIAFIFYFIADIFWAALEDRVVPVTRFAVLFDTFCLYVGMEMITYTWLQYVMAVEQVENRNRKINRFAVIFPFLISTVILFITYFIKPSFLISDDLIIQDGFTVFLVTVPYINLFAIMYYTIRKAISEENSIEKRKHIYIGCFPLFVVAGGVVEMFYFPHEPIFCCCSTILMLIFFIQMIERQISVDPLTGLNNRGQLLRYTSQNSNMYKEGRKTYVVMIDINDFKDINDTYGHAEGDKALILLSDALKSVITRHNIPIFIGRYGGDEFIMIVHPQDEEELKRLNEEIRTEIANSCLENKTKFSLTVGIGYDELEPEPDNFQKCMQRADKKLYLDKEYIKRELLKKVA